MPGPLRPDAPALPGERGRPRVTLAGRPGAAGAAPPGARARARDLRLPIAVGAVGLAAVTYLGVSDPYRPGGHVLCPVLALTGLYCAGCGAQRAVHSLVHGDLATAWDMNPLAVLLAPLVLVAWGRWLHGRWRGAGWRRTAGAAPAAHPVSPSTWALVGVGVAFAVLRNVPPLAPWLAP